MIVSDDLSVIRAVNTDLSTGGKISAQINIGMRINIQVCLLGITACIPIDLDITL